MTWRSLDLAVLATLLVLAPASAGASTTRARPPVVLTASPARVELAGTARAIVRMRNSGVERAVVDVSRAGFALDLRGRPRVVATTATRRSAARWLSVRPRRLVLRPGASGALTIASTVPARAEPGDYDALVLLTTRRRATRRVVVRMRMGVVVVVRAPGAVIRRLRLRRVRVVASRRSRGFELVVANQGNVTESFSRGRAVVYLHRAGRRVARLLAESRALRPGTVGVLQFRFRRKVVGRVLARIEVVSDSGRVIRRTLRLRL